MPGRITVEIGLFGAFRQLSRDESFTLEMPSGVSLRDVRVALSQEILRRHPEFSGQKLLEVSALADETAILRNDDVLSRNTKLAILPPISGG